MDYETQIAVRDAEAAIVRFLVREKKSLKPRQMTQNCPVNQSSVAPCGRVCSLRSLNKSGAAIIIYPNKKHEAQGGAFENHVLESKSGP